MAGSLAPVMYWAIRTTLCSTLRAEAEQLPYKAVMQPGCSFDGAAVEPFEDLRTYAKYFQSPWCQLEGQCTQLQICGLEPHDLDSSLT